MDFRSADDGAAVCDDDAHPIGTSRAITVATFSLLSELSRGTVTMGDSTTAAATPGPKPGRPRQKQQVRFTLSFVAIAGVLFAFYCFPYRENGISEAWFTSYLEGYARVVGWILSAFEPNVTVTDNNVIGRFSMSIIKSCDAMEANILFCAAALALPAPAARKAIAVPAGLLALIAANVVRLCCLYYVGVYAPSSFEFLHIEVWPLVMIVFALADFIVCARWLQGPELALPSAEEEIGHASA